VDLTGDINKGSQLSPGFTWSVYVTEREDVPNVLYTQCGWYIGIKYNLPQDNTVLFHSPLLRNVSMECVGYLELNLII
jgi:hypothetical protein